jgi:hypothetical protein
MADSATKRALYQYSNVGIAVQGNNKRAEYQYSNVGIAVQWTNKRAEYQYDNVLERIVPRAFYQYENPGYNASLYGNVERGYYQYENVIPSGSRRIVIFI